MLQPDDARVFSIMQLAWGPHCTFWINISRVSVALGFLGGHPRFQIRPVLTFVILSKLAGQLLPVNFTFIVLLIHFLGVVLYLLVD